MSSLVNRTGNYSNVLILHWSSEQGSMVDALALSGDEGRDYLRKVSGSWLVSFDPVMSEWGNPAGSASHLHLNT
jgi:hypothetical protein